MKKTLFLIVIFLLLLNLIACGEINDEAFGNDNLTVSDSASKNVDNDTISCIDSSNSDSSDILVSSSEPKNVEDIIKHLINEIDGTKIDSLTVMEDNNSSNVDNYKVYAIITWNRKHTASDSKQTIINYSDSIASSVNDKLGNIQDLFLVWIVPNLDSTASITYEKTDGMLSLKEEAFNKNFGAESQGTTTLDYRVINVSYISQLYPVKAIVGCEGTSLLMGLKAKGYAQEIELKKFLDNMPRHPSNPAKGFVGSPYVADLSKKTRTTIYPPILADYGTTFGNVVDFSGSSIEKLREQLLDGNPVVVYATMNWGKPLYKEYEIEGSTQKLLSNNHAVLVCGYHKKSNMYYIVDPYNVKDTSKEKRYWINGNTFERIYNERRHALVIQ